MYVLVGYSGALDAFTQLATHSTTKGDYLN